MLPLVDLASEVETRRTLPEIMSDHGDVLIGFLISFIVTWVLWRNHHAIMENYCEYNSPMMNLCISSGCSRSCCCLSRRR